MAARRYFSNQAIGQILREACLQTSVPREAVQIVQSKDHALVRDLLQLEEYIDLVIPRGGEELIRDCGRPFESAGD